MFITPLITETYIKQHTPIGMNVDVELLESNIEWAQEAFVQDILGTALYEDIQTKYLGLTLSVDEQALMLYIKPFLAYKTAETALAFMRGQIRNKGIVNMNSENATQDNEAYMRYLRDELKGRCEFLAQRLITYLCNNSSLFPLYSVSQDDIYPTSSSQFECDLWFESPSCSCLKCGSNYDCGCNE